MNVTGVLAVLAVVCVVWFVVASLRIYDYLRRRGYSVHFPLLRLMLPVYVNRYKEITRAENGRVGALFYHWIVSINAALVLAVVGVVLSH